MQLQFFLANEEQMGKGSFLAGNVTLDTSPATIFSPLFCLPDFFPLMDKFNPFIWNPNFALNSLEFIDLTCYANNLVH